MRSLSIFNSVPIDRFLGDFFDDVNFPIPHRREAVGVEIEETDKSIKFSVDLPGIEKDDIDLHIKDNHLIVSAERKDARKKEEKDRVYSYRHYGKIEKSYYLGDRVDPQNIEASYNNGVLDIIAHKAKEAQPKKIEILSKPQKLLS